MQKNRKRFYLLFGIQSLIIIIIGFFFLTDFNDFSFFDKDDTIFIEQSKRCDLHKNSCTITLNVTQKITFSITPKHIPLMKPLTFEAIGKGIDATELNLKIYATNMNMGIHNFTLTKKGKNIYTSSGILPTCIVGNMIWNAEITSDAFLDNLGARFTFKTDI